MSKKQTYNRISNDVKYNLNTRIIKKGTYSKEHLTKKEERLLLLLSNNEINLYEDICDYVEISKNTLKSLKSRLVEKTNLQIERYDNIGYILKDNVLIDNTKENEKEFLQNYKKDMINNRVKEKIDQENTLKELANEVNNDIFQYIIMDFKDNYSLDIVRKVQDISIAFTKEIIDECRTKNSIKIDIPYKEIDKYVQNNLDYILNTTQENNEEELCL